MKKTTQETKKKQATMAEVDSSFVPVVAAFAGHGNVTSGKMMSSLGLKVDGKIFAMLVKGQFVAKLPRERVDELVNGGDGEYFDPGPRQADERVGRYWSRKGGLG